MNPDIESTCAYIRLKIDEISGSVLVLKKDDAFKGEQKFEGQHSEMIANIMLAYRHLEDAKMRIGKVMQQVQGGVSINQENDEKLAARA